MNLANLFWIIAIGIKLKTENKAIISMIKLGTLVWKQKRPLSDFNKGHHVELQTSTHSTRLDSTRCCRHTRETKILLRDARMKSEATVVVNAWFASSGRSFSGRELGRDLWSRDGNSNP